MLDQLEGQHPLAARLLALMSKPTVSQPPTYLFLSQLLFMVFNQQEIRIMALPMDALEKASLLPAIMDMKFGSLMPTAF